MIKDSSELGFPTWLDVYNFLVENELQNEQKATLTWPEEEERADVTIPVNYVKAMAFSEVYERMPGTKSCEFIAELVSSSEMTDDDKKTVLMFLTKIPNKP